MNGNCSRTTNCLAYLYITCKRGALVWCSNRSELLIRLGFSLALVDGLRIKGGFVLNPYHDVCLLFQANANFAFLDLNLFHAFGKRLPKALLRTKLLHQVDIFYTA